MRHFILFLLILIGCDTVDGPTKIMGCYTGINKNNGTRRQYIECDQKGNVGLKSVDFDSIQFEEMTCEACEEKYPVLICLKVVYKETQEVYEELGCMTLAEETEYKNNHSLNGNDTIHYWSKTILHCDDCD